MYSLNFYQLVANIPVDYYRSNLHAWDSQESPSSGQGYPFDQHDLSSLPGRLHPTSALPSCTDQSRSLEAVHLEKLLSCTPSIYKKIEPQIDFVHVR